MTDRIKALLDRLFSNTIRSKVHIRADLRDIRDHIDILLEMLED